MLSWFKISDLCCPGSNIYFTLKCTNFNIHLSTSTPPTLLQISEDHCWLREASPNSWRRKFITVNRLHITSPSHCSPAIISILQPRGWGISQGSKPPIVVALSSENSHLSPQHHRHLVLPFFYALIWWEHLETAVWPECRCSVCSGYHPFLRP